MILSIHFSYFLCSDYKYRYPVYRPVSLDHSAGALSTNATISLIVIWESSYECANNISFPENAIRLINFFSEGGFFNAYNYKYPDTQTDNFSQINTLTFLPTGASTNDLCLPLARPSLRLTLSVKNKAAPLLSLRVTLSAEAKPNKQVRPTALFASNAVSRGEVSPSSPCV